MTDCTAPRHDTLTAYKLGCRCPDARRAGARAQKAHRTRVARGQRFHTDSNGAQRRIQALAAIGWRAQDIATRIGTTSQCVSQIGIRPTIYVTTARRIADVYAELADTPGPSPVTRARAAAKGWLEPKWWDDDLIDDPTYTPPTVDQQHWSDVDDVAVQRAVAGDPVPLTRAERIRAVLTLHEAGMTHRQIGRHLNIHDRQVLRDVAQHGQRAAS